jgi:MYXO-CTERM domain-containing protein
MACVGERSDRTLLACGANWSPDNFALGRSSDGAAWSKIFRFVELAGPLSCPAGTIQHDVCEVVLWRTLQSQLGIPDAPVADAGTAVPAPGGCGCAASGAGAAAVGLALAVAAGLGLRRRRCCS